MPSWLEKLPRSYLSVPRLDQGAHLEGRALLTAAMVKRVKGLFESKLVHVNWILLIYFLAGQLFELVHSINNVYESRGELEVQAV